MGLHDQFAIDAGTQGTIVTLFTVADFPLTVEEVNELTEQDREFINELFVNELSDWQVAAQEAVEAWREWAYGEEERTDDDH